MADKTVATNHKAYHDYFIEESLEAGVVLVGAEIKSIRAGRVSIREAYARIDGREAWLIGMHVAPYAAAGRFTEYDPNRRRKLLLHRDEIVSMQTKIREKGVTLVPLRIYLKDDLAKVEVGLARGTRPKDKQDTIAKHDLGQVHDAPTARIPAAPLPVVASPAGGIAASRPVRWRRYLLGLAGGALLGIAALGLILAREGEQFPASGTSVPTRTATGVPPATVLASTPVPVVATLRPIASATFAPTATPTVPARQALPTPPGIPTAVLGVATLRPIASATFAPTATPTAPARQALPTPPVTPSATPKPPAATPTANQQLAEVRTLMERAYAGGLSGKAGMDVLNQLAEIEKAIDQRKFEGAREMVRELIRRVQESARKSEVDRSLADRIVAGLNRLMASLP